MRTAPIPTDEPARQRALEELAILDTPPEAEFDDLTQLAAVICETPIALISLVDNGRQWFKSVVGLPVAETPRAISFCGHAIVGGDLFEVPDAEIDPRFADNPLVRGSPGVRFYAGVPLSPNGRHNVGALCVVDVKPRQLTDAQRDALRALGRQVDRVIRMRDAARREQDLRRDLFHESELSRSMIEYAGEAIISTDLGGVIRSFNPAAEQLLGYAANEVVGVLTPEAFHVAEEVGRAATEASAREGRPIEGFEALAMPVIRDSVVSQEWTYRRKDGSRVPVHLTISTRKDEAGVLTGFLAVARDLSERRALTSETAINRAIVEHAGAAIIATTLEGVITAFNPAAEQLLGYHAAELIGTATPERFHDREEVMARAAELSGRFGEPISGFETFVRPLRDKAADTAEWTYVRKDGGRIPVMLTVSSLKDGASRPVGYLGVVRDLTERHRQALQEKTVARIADIVRRSQGDFIARVPPAALFDTLLSQVLDFTGSTYGFIGEVSRDERNAPYLKTYALTNIAWSEETRRLYEASKATGFMFGNMETLFGAAITSRQPVIANDPATDPRRGGLPPGHPAMKCFLGLPLMYGEEMVGLIGLANREQGYDEKLMALLDPLGVSCASLIQALRLEAGRAAANATLAEQENRLRVILETAADCFIEVAPNGCITEWNHLAETSLQISRDAAVGRPFDDVVRLKTTRGELASVLDFYPADDGSLGRPREVTAVLPDGSSFPAELVMWPVPSTAGVGHCAFLRNIGERKQLEEQQRLRFQSETLLKEVHHRVKNNMQVISSLLSIQSSKLENERQRGVFLECRERIRAMSLIHDRLYSTGNYEQIDFGDYLREMLSLIVSSNRTDGTDIEVDLQAIPLWVPVERAVPLSLIASELVLNALKHGCQGRPRGKVSVRLAKKGSDCRLFVGDDGPGMTASAADGTGVGMQLIDSLTRQIRGSYEVQGSPPGWGVSVRWRET